MYGNFIFPPRKTAQRTWCRQLVRPSLTGFSCYTRERFPLSFFCPVSRKRSLVIHLRWQMFLSASIYCRPPGFTVVSPGKYLAGSLQSGCTANLTGAQYILLSAYQNPQHFLPFARGNQLWSYYIIPCNEKRGKISA